MRKTIAQRLGKSYKEAVHVTEHRTANAEPLIEAAEAATEYYDVDVSVSDILLSCLSATLDTHPEFNARFEDETHRLYEEHNIGVAVDVDDGLIAPVIPELQDKSIAEVAEIRREITGRANDGNYTMEDLSNSTFTVTNLGILGVESFTPIINPPNIAILGMNAIQEEPVVEEGEVISKQQLPLDLSFDHRVVDGADAARFLQTLKQHIEEPWSELPVEASESRDSDRGGTEMPHRDVAASLVDHLKGSVEAGPFEVPFDEPKEVGGTETAPSPVDLLLSSLAACLSASFQFQAVEKHDLDLSTLEVRVNGRPDSGHLEEIEVSLQVGLNAEDDQIEKIIEFAEQGCHVSNALSDEIPLSITWERAYGDSTGDR